jgi:hypothetical protein
MTKGAIRAKRRMPVMAVVAAVAGAMLLGAAAPPPAAASTKLSFEYADGWSSAERTAIARTIDAAYPEMVRVYGRPAISMAVTIVPDDTQAGWAHFAGSYLYTGGTAKAVRAEVHVSHADVATEEGRLNLIVHEVLHGFHGPYAMDRDADEEGMTEAASTIVGRRIAAGLGLPGYSSDPVGAQFQDVRISVVVAADQQNVPVMAAPSFYNSTRQSRPQVQSMYGAAAVYWLTLTAQRPTILSDVNVRWYRSPARTGKAAAQVKALKAITAALVSTVGAIDFATWRGRQQITRVSHPPGTHLRCLDVGPQAGAAAAMPGGLRVMMDADLIVTDGKIDDTPYSGDATISLLDATGATVTQTSGRVADGSLWTLLLDPVPGPGAYRYVVSVPGDGGTRAVGSCWTIAGVQSAGRLLVIGTPGSSITATLPLRDATTGSTARASVTQTVGADGLAVFEGTQPGLADVGVAGSSPAKEVLVATGGAIVALVSPDPAVAVP